MKLRRVTSLTALISFLVLVLNSIILYIVPEGRIAYWADWHLLGLTKSQWGAQHVIIGFLFLAAILLHIYYNWKVLLAYLKDRAKKVKVLTKEFNVAVAITALCLLGSFFPVGPFGWILDLSEHFKRVAEVTYGNPPYGHAELSPLKSLAKRTGLDLADAMVRLEAAGVEVESEDQIVQDIAEVNGVSPSKIYKIMTPPEEEGKPKPMPTEAMSGTGKKSIQDICETYGLDLPTVLQGLADRGIQVTRDMILRDAGAANGMGPDEVYGLIREAAGGAAISDSVGGVALPEQASKADVPELVPPQGLGSMTLEEVCRSVSVDLEQATQRLLAQDIVAAPESKMRKLSDAHGMTPKDLFSIMTK